VDIVTDPLQGKGVKKKIYLPMGGGGGGCGPGFGGWWGGRGTK
jgi:hypothetical protein